MGRIILSEASQTGIKGTTKRKFKPSQAYQQSVIEANKRINEDRYRYAEAYKKAANYLAR